MVADRRRFERALHDAVQQDLVALAVELQLLGARVEDPAVEELRRAVHDALGRARALADEIYPSVLDAQGLRGTTRRYPPELEAVVALCSRTAAAAAIREEPGRLVVELRGVADRTAARDLLEAAGASVTVEPDLLRAVFSP